MAHQKTTSKKAASAAPRVMRTKGSAKDVKSAASSAMKPGNSKRGKRKS